MLILSGQDQLDNARAYVEKARLLEARTYFFARAIDQKALVRVQLDRF